MGDDRHINLEEFRTVVMLRPIGASDGNHSARLVRIAENLDAAVKPPAPKKSDDRLLHLMSRVGVLTRTMATDLRSGYLSVDDASTLLEQLAVLGEQAFSEWMKHDD